MKRLGATQFEVLSALESHGGIWYPSCGWIWGNRSTTERIFKSLEKKGCVYFTNNQYSRLGGFKITPLGKNMLEEGKQGFYKGLNADMEQQFISRGGN